MAQFLEIIFTTVKGALLFGVLIGCLFVWITGGYNIGNEE